ncbi:hypothetical protein CEXT_233741 [Caerostris extrusa]|uniref:Uncharacterized protein n=1 Tax=Caerostris extrusa TaxID=172846 RepID=A0AAV4VWF7_CAEEX|nr:hypothetical protein CEXT_233741 [Caerostris extrusa]
MKLLIIHNYELINHDVNHEIILGTTSTAQLYVDDVQWPFATTHGKAEPLQSYVNSNKDGNFIKDGPSELPLCCGYSSFGNKVSRTFCNYKCRTHDRPLNLDSVNFYISGATVEEFWLFVS